MASQSSNNYKNVSVPSKEAARGEGETGVQEGGATRSTKQAWQGNGARDIAGRGGSNLAQPKPSFDNNMQFGEFQQLTPVRTASAPPAEITPEPPQRFSHFKTNMNYQPQYLSYQAVPSMQQVPRGRGQAPYPGVMTSNIPHAASSPQHVSQAPQPQPQASPVASPAMQQQVPHHMHQNHVGHTRMNRGRGAMRHTPPNQPYINPPSYFNPAMAGMYQIPYNPYGIPYMQPPAQQQFDTRETPGGVTAAPPKEKKLLEIRDPATGQPLDLKSVVQKQLAAKSAASKPAAATAATKNIESKQGPTVAHPVATSTSSSSNITPAVRAKPAVDGRSQQTSIPPVEGKSIGKSGTATPAVTEEKQEDKAAALSIKFGDFGDDGEPEESIPEKKVEPGRPPSQTTSDVERRQESQGEIAGSIHAESGAEPSTKVPTETRTKPQIESTTYAQAVAPVKSELVPTLERSQEQDEKASVQSPPPPPPATPVAPPPVATPPVATPPAIQSTVQPQLHSKEDVKQASSVEKSNTMSTVEEPSNEPETSAAETSVSSQSLDTSEDADVESHATQSDTAAVVTANVSETEDISESDNGKESNVSDAGKVEPNQVTDDQQQPSKDVDEEKGPNAEAQEAEASNAKAPMPSLRPQEVDENVVDVEPPGVSLPGGRRVYSKEVMTRIRDDIPFEELAYPNDLRVFDIVSDGPPRGFGQSARFNRGDFQGRGSTVRGGVPLNGRMGRGKSPSRTRPLSGNEDRWVSGQEVQPPPPVLRDNRNKKGGRPSYQAPVLTGPVEPLKHSENRWVPQKDVSPMKKVLKKVQGILNKMTREKFDKLANQLLAIRMESSAMLSEVIKLVFDKAIDEPNFGDMYADLCARLDKNSTLWSFVKTIWNEDTNMWHWSADVSVGKEVLGPFSSSDEAMEKVWKVINDEEPAKPIEYEGNLEITEMKIKGGMFVMIVKSTAPPSQYYSIYRTVQDAMDTYHISEEDFNNREDAMRRASKKTAFRRFLLNKCQEEYEKEDIYEDLKKQEAEMESSELSEDEKREKQMELEEQRIKIKHRMLGNIRFIGELYKKEMLREVICADCISGLLKLNSGDDQPKGRNIPAPLLEDEDIEALCKLLQTVGKKFDSQQSATMNAAFARLHEISNDKRYEARIRFMVKDLIELRENKWEPRRKQMQMKTLEEVRKDAELEQQMATRGGNSRRDSRDNRTMLGRNSMLGGRSSSMSQDVRSGGRLGGNRFMGERPQRTSGMGMNSGILNPGVVRNFSPSGNLAQRSMGGMMSGGGPPIRDAQSPGRYSRVPPKPVPVSKNPRKPEIYYRVQTVKGIVTNEKPDIQLPAKRSSIKPVTNEDQQRNRIRSTIQEYMATKDINEALICFQESELNGQRVYPAVFRNILEMTYNSRKAAIPVILELMEMIMFDKRIEIKQEDFDEGIRPLLEVMEGDEPDVPHIFDTMSEVLVPGLIVEKITLDWVVAATENEFLEKENCYRLILTILRCLLNKEGFLQARFAVKDFSIRSLLGSNTDEYLLRYDVDILYFTKMELPAILQNCVNYDELQSHLDALPSTIRDSLGFVAFTVRNYLKMYYREEEGETAPEDVVRFLVHLCTKNEQTKVASLCGMMVFMEEAEANPVTLVPKLLRLLTNHDIISKDDLRSLQEKGRWLFFHAPTAFKDDISKYFQMMED